jgi:peroxiredoxin
MAGVIASKKWTVLNFYPGAFSQHCMLEVHGLKHGIEKYYGLTAHVASHLVNLVEKYAEFRQCESCLL